MYPNLLSSLTLLPPPLGLNLRLGSMAVERNAKVPGTPLNPHTNVYLNVYLNETNQHPNKPEAVILTRIGKVAVHLLRKVFREEQTLLDPKTGLALVLATPVLKSDPARVYTWGGVWGMPS